MIRLTAICAAVLAFVLVSPAQAQWYVSAHGGGVWLQDSDVEDSFAGGSASGEGDFDAGWVLGGAVGHNYGGVRVEGEVSYRQNDIDSVTVDSLTIGPSLFTALGTFDVDGEADSLAIMANAWLDVDAGGRWKPYIGGGIGAVRLGIDVNAIEGLSTSYDDEDWVFGYQLGAGIGYQLAANTVLSLDYRFFGTSDPEFEDGGETVEAEYLSHNLMVGVRFGF